MSIWQLGWFGPRRSDLRRRITELEQAIAAATSELGRKEQQLVLFREEASRSRTRETDRLAAALHTQLEELMQLVATPAAQFIRYAEDCAAGRLQPDPNRLLALCGRWMNAFQSAGLSLDGSIGEIVVFDPNIHQAHPDSPVLGAGQSARIEIPGVHFRSVRLRKATVCAL